MKKLKRRPTKPSFDTLADMAAVACYRSSKCPMGLKLTDKEILARIHLINSSENGASAMPTFKQPTDCKTGFFNVLRIIAINTIGSSGFSTRYLCSRLQTKSLGLTLRRLESAGLISLDRETHEWRVTEFGKRYLNALREEFELEWTVLPKI